MKQQIEASVSGWRADRAKCSDGSHIFIGSKGPVLVFMAPNRIFLGRFAQDGLVQWHPLQQLPNGTWAFPPPDIRAQGTTEVL